MLTKAVVHYLGDGPFAWVDNWESYALAVASIGGVVIAQSALQTGALGAAIGASEAMIPLTAAALGLGLLDEGIDAEGFGWAIVAIAAIAIPRAILRLGRNERLLPHTGATPGLLFEPER